SRHTRFSRDWSSDVCSSDLSPALTRNRRSRRVSTSRSTSVRLTFGSCPSRSAEGARSAGGVPPAVREPAVAAARKALAMSSSPLPRGGLAVAVLGLAALEQAGFTPTDSRSEEHTSELQSRENLVCGL